MKCLSLLVTVALMCIAFIGCGADSLLPDNTDVTLPGNIDVPLTTFENYKDYKNFLRTSELPDDFVIYDDIAHFGEFEGFVVLSDVQNDDYSQVIYNLKDSAGQSLGLYIFTTAREHENDTVIDKVDSDDLRRISSGAGGVYTLLGVDYRYVSGELLSMTWVKNGVEHVLMGDSMLSDYPQNANTVISKMLDRRLVGTVEY